MFRKQKKPPDRVLSPQQAAAIAWVTPGTLRKWEKMGRLSSLRTGTGKQRRYLESEVLAVASGRVAKRAT